MQQRGSVKKFVEQPLGRIILAALATVTLLGSLLFLGALIAIPTFLFFGLLIPIYLGWKRPRQLAVVGLAALLVAAPLAALYEAQVFRQPSAAASSASGLPWGDGGSVLQEAVVSPFTLDNGGPFNFSVTVHPEFVPPNTSGLLWVELFVSTCPGATSNTSLYCSGPYPFFSQNRTLGANLSQPFTESFIQNLSGANLWWFQFATAYRSGASQNITWIFLNPPSGYPGIEGPVSGDYLSTVGLIVPNIYAVMFLYPGVVFFIALLIYYVFKRREAARKAAAAPPSGGAGPPPPTTPPAGGEPPAASVGAGKPVEDRRCPKCQAIVYPNESSCWKCGAALPGAPPTEAPLAGGRSP